MCISKNVKLVKDPIDNGMDPTSPKEKGFILDKKSSGIDTFTSYVRRGFFHVRRDLLLRKYYVRREDC